MTVLYLDTSAVLRVVLEAGASPGLGNRIASAEHLVTSRLSLVESARALFRATEAKRITELQRVDAEREIDGIWARCHVWEITRAVCGRAATVAPRMGLRALDAIHLATMLEARKRLGPDVELLTVDERLSKALSAL